MRPINECIIITEAMFAGMFSGSDVWLIPMEWKHQGGDFSRSYPVLHPKKASVSDHWYIEDDCVYNYDDEICAIAVEPEQIQWRTAPEYMEENDD